MATNRVYLIGSPESPLVKIGCTDNHQNVASGTGRRVPLCGFSCSLSSKVASSLRPNFTGVLPISAATVNGSIWDRIRSGL